MDELKARLRGTAVIMSSSSVTARALKVASISAAVSLTVTVTFGTSPSISMS